MRRALAPGYYECQDSVLRDVVPAGAQGNAVPIPLYETCGHRYQMHDVQQFTRACGFGMFAVGQCVLCGQALCGQHVLSRSPGVMCATHADEYDAPIRKAAQAAAQAEAARYDEELALWERDLAAQLNAIKNPVEAFLRLLVESPSANAPDYGFVHEVVPERAQPSDDAVAAWWCKHTAEPPRDLPREYKTWLGAVKERPAPGWRFGGSSNKVNPLPFGEQEFAPIYFWVDGCVSYSHPTVFGRMPNEHFTELGLRGVFKRSGLKPLPLKATRPPPRSRSF